MNQPSAFTVSVQSADFKVDAEQRALLQGNSEEGAVCTFTGYVRASNIGEAVDELELEHYPGMTEKKLLEILQSARERWPLLAARIVHRVGRLRQGEQIVWVGVSSGHREAAHSACEYLMDFLKTEAPFWKKEHGPGGERWVDARASDFERGDRWR